MRSALSRVSRQLALSVIAAGTVSAQVTLAVKGEMQATPYGRSLAVLRKGATVATGAARSGFTHITIEGFVDAALLGGPRDSFAVTIKSSNGALLHTGADQKAPVIAELGKGMGLALVSRSKGWARVKRAGWITTRTLAGPAQAAGSRPAATSQPAPSRAAAPAPVAPAAEPPPAGPPPAGALTPSRRASIRLAPDARVVAEADSGAWLEPLTRERGWVRVRLDGWMRESDLLPADTALGGALSAADLRAEPVATKGRVVHWNVEVYGLQTADPLRRDFAPDEPYLLARGPSGENALLYLAIPPSLVDAARGLPPLAAVTVTARVRTGRSEPTGVPILDVQTLIRR
jgi:hypothetical protein